MVVYLEGRNVRPVPLYKQGKQGHFPHLRPSLLQSQKSPPPSSACRVERGQRKERATFPPELSAKELREWYYLFWSTETRAHPRTKVLSAVASQAAPVGGYPFFAVFFYCGLCPPFSDFFCDVMNTYGLHLLDFTPNAVLTMAVFAHLCENFVGVHPNVALFRHFFMPRVERGEPLAGGIAWISRDGKKETYLEGELRQSFRIDGRKLPWSRRRWG